MRWLAPSLVKPRAPVVNSVNRPANQTLLRLFSNKTSKHIWSAFYFVGKMFQLCPLIIPVDLKKKNPNSHTAVRLPPSFNDSPLAAALQRVCVSCEVLQHEGQLAATRRKRSRRQRHPLLHSEHRRPLSCVRRRHIRRLLAA